ncbi:MAG TPA: glycosyl transferase [Lachnospiraceae bacterium]|nr:glycosyl transferase [Lachnospiraceae bacterium]
MAEIADGDNVKVIAFYLPQYHPISENDKAWGKGFTEWTNVKKAKPLFEGHYQPKIPLNGNYYNLLDGNTARWQSDLAQQNGIFGFCYYHYWFSGRKLLEKPAERMLNNMEVTIPFCFCWANENWTRKWNGAENEVIMEQDYGDRADWERHFEYLLPFFEDSRYITLNGKPVFIIYRPELIPDVNDFTHFIKKRCIEEGLKGCEIIFQRSDFMRNEKLKHTLEYDHCIAFEPLHSWLEITWERIWSKAKRTLFKSKHTVYTVRDYDKTWRQILRRSFRDRKMIAGAFTDWDNTARNRCGLLYKGASPEKFASYMSRLVKKVYKSGRLNVVFLTAWNEWGEGSYLEPDEKNGFAYLQAVRDAVHQI